MMDTGDTPQQQFPIVGLGASAGGLDALRRFFEVMPAHSGMAFVVVTHLDPARESHLTPILDRVTAMDVTAIEDGMRIQPGCVYVRPSGGVLSMRDGIMRISPPVSRQARYQPINLFFHSLAEEHGDRAICIILSGTGTDGTLGLRAIKQHGGMCIAQADGTAAHAGMRLSAISTGLVDFVLEPAEMPACLIEYVRHQRQLAEGRLEGKLVAGERNQLDQILERLHKSTGYDLKDYKKSTLLRRVRRRMQVARLQEPEDYLALLDRADGEAKLLFHDLLIGVTQFFRGEEAFETLAREVLPALLEAKPPNEAIRVWVPGCSSGEEVYSLAILVAEELKRRGHSRQVNIFGTDIDEEALTAARTGIYSLGIEKDISPERLETWFRRTDDRLFVVDELREMCTFSTHDLVQDPPFSRLDVISCRNLFIYFESGLQKRLLPLLHFALRPRGFLILGRSEVLHGFDELFETVDKAQRIFRRKEPALKPKLEFPLGRGTRPPPVPVPHRRQDLPAVRRLAEKYLLEHRVPACVVVDSSNRCVFFAGNTSEFLQPPSGVPNLNILDMARAGLRSQLQRALDEAGKERRSVMREFSAPLQGREQALAVVVRPLATYRNGDLHCLVLIEKREGPRSEAARQPDREERPADAEHVGTVERLEEELQMSRYELRTTTEDLETANEELQSSNEELLSSNEELQSLVEELETSKEELQSLNEELEIINAKQGETVAELKKANDDLLNLHSCTDLPVVFLDRELRVQMFTPAATRLFHLIPEDVGRSIGDIAYRHDYAAFRDDVKRVLQTGESVECEATSDGHRLFHARVFPYRTVEGELTGAVATFLDVTEHRRLTDEAELRARQQSAVARVGLFAIGQVDLDRVMREAVQEAKRVLAVDFCAVFEQDRPGERLVLRSGAGWRPEGDDHTLPLGPASQAGYTIEADSPVVIDDISTEFRFTLSQDMLEQGIVSSLSVVIAGDDAPFGALAAYSRKRRRFSQEDVDFLQAVANLLATAIRRSRAEAELLEKQRQLALKDTQEKIERAERLASLGTLAAGIAHEINNPLNAIWMTAELAKQTIARNGDSKRLDKLMDRIVAECERSAAITRGVLDFSRPSAELPAEGVSLNEIVRNVRGRLQGKLQQRESRLQLDLDETLPAVDVNAMEMERVFVNLVSNAMEAGASEICVSTGRMEGEARIVAHVRDNGPGISEAHMDKIFDPFFSTRRNEGGTGLGLSLVHRSVQNGGGTISASNQPSGGADFVIELPLREQGGDPLRRPAEQDSGARTG